MPRIRGGGSDARTVAALHGISAAPYRARIFMRPSFSGRECPGIRQKKSPD
jgi:hypothetical protein